MTAEIKNRNPYPGPRPFEREEQRLFFGREREVRELRSLITAHRAVLLYAQSGAGKTSLLNAGLIPLLTKQSFEVLPVARVRGFEPEDIDLKGIPNIYVFNTLVGWAGDNVEPGSLVSTSIVTFLEEREHLMDEQELPLPRVAIFDQFEELFTSYPGRWKEREDFFSQVVEALEADPLLRVLFVIREDYLASLDSYIDFLPERLRTRCRLERLRAEAACQAVERPIRDTGRTFAEGVASRLVNKLLNIRVENAAGEIVETPGEYVEPVQLQIVCQSLWVNLPREVTVITSNHLQEFGDVKEALRSFYERAIETAKRQTGVRESSLRTWFNDKLITPAGTRGTVFQGKEQTEGIANSAVEVLEAQHIIRAERRAGARWYELTHDRLIEPIRKSNAQAQARTARRRRRFAAALSAICIFAFAAMIFVCVSTYSLTVTAVDGFVTIDPNKANYDRGETVVLTAVPDPNYRFDGWSGALSDSNNLAKLVMDGDKQVTAIFALKTYSLEISGVGGSVTKSPDKANYNHGETLLLIGVPKKGYSFIYWSGDLSDSNNRTTLVMDADKSVTASFVLNTYNLTATAVDGSIAKVPDQARYKHGETVTLEAMPNEGYSFNYWSGDLSGDTNPATLVMYADKSVNASFALRTDSIKGYNLTVFAVGGSVTKSPDKAHYKHGEKVTLVAVPNNGYTFIDWSGDLSGDTNPATLVMVADKSVTASFVLNTYNLTAPAVDGSITKVPDQARYKHGEEVTLVAVPNEGYFFMNWSGDLSDSNNPETLIMDADKSVNANFAALKVKAGGYVITSSLISNKCLNVKDINVEAKTQYYGDPDQQWSLKHVGHGHYRIMAKDNEKMCLEIVEGGTNIQLNEWQNTENQKWTLESAGKDCYKIIAKHSDKCLDIDESSERAIQNTDSDSDSQRWQLKPVEQLWIGNITVTMKYKLPQGKGWKKIPVNLNEGVWLSPAIWLWVRGPARNNITVTSSKGPVPKKPAGEGWKKIPVNLNEGRKGKAKYIYLWVRGPAKNNIAVTIGRGTWKQGTMGKGWMQIGPDLNEGAWGKYLYLWVR